MFANEIHIVGVNVRGRFVLVDYSDAPSSPYFGSGVSTYSRRRGWVDWYLWEEEVVIVDITLGPNRYREYTALDNGFFVILGNVLRDKIHRILGVNEIPVRQKDSAYVKTYRLIQSYRARYNNKIS